VQVVGRAQQGRIEFAQGAQYPDRFILNISRKRVSDPAQRDVVIGI